MSFLEDFLEWFFSAGNEWFSLGARQVLSQICWTSNIPPRWRWPMGNSNNCGISSDSGPGGHLTASQPLIWRLMWVVPLVVSRASQVAGYWTSFQSYNRKKARERVESLISLPPPILIITVLSVVSVNGDGLLLVMDTALMTFVVKVFWVLMRVAVVRVDDVVDGGVSNWYLSLDGRPQLLHRALQLLHLQLRCQIMDNKHDTGSQNNVDHDDKTDQFRGVCCPRNIQRSKLLGLGRGRKSI